MLPELKQCLNDLDLILFPFFYLVRITINFRNGILKLMVKFSNSPDETISEVFKFAIKTKKISI